MACPKLEEGSLCRCAAVRGFVVPSLHERERFCLTDGWPRCPTFVASAAYHAPLPEEAYYAIWLPSRREALGPSSALESGPCESA